MRKNWFVIFIFIFSLSNFGFAADSISDGELFAESLRLYKDGNYSESSIRLVQLIKQDPRKPLYWFNLGNNSFMLKRFDKALLYYNKVISLNTSLVDAATLFKAKTF